MNVLNKDDFCSKIGGTAINNCTNGTITGINCVCGLFEGFIGQICTDNVLNCKFNAEILSKECKCGENIVF